MMMHLFIDGSADPQSKIGYGCFLLIDDVSLEGKNEDFVRKHLRLKKFYPTTSTKLEMQALIWALREAKTIMKDHIENLGVTIYSDSQNIFQLQNRKSRLQSRRFKSKSGNKDLNLAEIYQDIFEILANFKCKFKKLKGHSKKREKSGVERVFAQVDRAARKALRNDLKEISK